MALSNTTPCVKLFEQICRLCLKKFSTPHGRFLIRGTNIENHSLEEILTKFFEIEVHENDKMPQYICSQCIFSLGQVRNFYELCQSSRQTLAVLLENEANKKAPIHIVVKKAAAAATAAAKAEPVECPRCTMTFPTELKYMEHQKMHQRLDFVTGSQPAQTPAEEMPTRGRPAGAAGKRRNPLQCTQCQLLFPTGYQLQKHRQTHDRPYSCQHCNKKFDSRTRLDSHLLKHEDNSLKRDHVGRLLQCEICHTVCSSYHTYRLHKHGHVGGLKPFVCPQCGMDFLISSHLKKHMVIHSPTRPFHCATCPKEFKTKLSLSQHVKNVHTEETPVEVKCNKCDRIFYSQKKLRNHKVSHISKPCLCPICGLYLSRQRYYPRHLRTHTGEKPYKCQHCEKAFKTTIQLRCHLNLHTGEKPFVCKMCDKGFASPKKLITHKKNHHKEPHKCIYCNEEFSKSVALTAHMKTHQDKIQSCIKSIHQYVKRVSDAGSDEST